jgi:hypothetical protein
MLATPDSRTPRFDTLALVIESEFKEMPGMRLTLAQVRRLWNLSTEDAAKLMANLVDEGRLTRDTAGQYCRCSAHCE